MQENKVKITNSDRVARILSKICQANLQVFVRAQDNLSLAVKAKASNILSVKLSGDNRVLTLRLSNISEQGMNYLCQKKKIRIEFIMMATKVMFVSQLVKTEQNTILVTFPKSLVSIERRKNARFSTNENALGYLKVGIWKPDMSDQTASPTYPQYRDIRGYLALADISLGGVCVQTRFPSVCQELTRGRIDESSKLILPMQAEIPIRFEVKWVKKIREHISEPDEESRPVTSYKFGCEFFGHADDIAIGIKQFMSQITQSEAI